jgi:hypothetical protein
MFNKFTRVSVIVATATKLFVLGGCQTENGGGGMGASGYDDDAHYLAPGPEFKFSREAVAQKTFAVEQKPTP